jgi:hypothetical protein
MGPVPGALRRAEKAEAPTLESGHPAAERDPAGPRPGMWRSPSPTTRSTAWPVECMEVAVKVRPPPFTIRYACRSGERYASVTRTRKPAARAAAMSRSTGAGQRIDRGEVVSTARASGAKSAGRMVRSRVPALPSSRRHGVWTRRRPGRSGPVGRHRDRARCRSRGERSGWSRTTRAGSGPRCRSVGGAAPALPGKPAA